MLTQEVVYKGTAVRVVMKEDSKALEEVVVIGYQTVNFNRGIFARPTATAYVNTGCQTLHLADQCLSLIHI